MMGELPTGPEPSSTSSSRKQTIGVNDPLLLEIRCGRIDISEGGGDDGKKLFHCNPSKGLLRVFVYDDSSIEIIYLSRPDLNIIQQWSLIEKSAKVERLPGKKDQRFFQIRSISESNNNNNNNHPLNTIEYFWFQEPKTESYNELLGAFNAILQYPSVAKEASASDDVIATLNDIDKKRIQNEQRDRITDEELDNGGFIDNDGDN